MLKNLIKRFVEKRDSKNTFFYETLIAKLFDKYSNREELVAEIAELGECERWSLFACFLAKKKFKVFHFLHVPKTGGTTFGETLSQDNKALIVSLDSTPQIFTSQLIRLVNASENSLVLSRAHHSLNTIKQSGCFEFFFLIITAYRDPVDIHISNVNMILRRLKRYYNEDSLSEAERNFCVEWKSVIEKPIEFNEKFALWLLESDVYAEKMGDVYSRFFNFNKWQKLITKCDLVVIPTQSFDRLFIDVFNYSVAPKRKNVSNQPFLSKQSCDINLSKLIKSDNEIVNYLKLNLIEPSSLRSRFDAFFPLNER